MEYQHQSFLTEEQNRANEHAHAINVASWAAAASVPSCLEAREQDYMMGGYSMIGVCLDSAALIQMALTGSTELFNLGGHPNARVSLACTCIELAEQAKQQLDWQEMQKISSRKAAEDGSSICIGSASTTYNSIFDEHHILSQFESQLRVLAESVLKLPQDYALQPAEYADAVRRFALSTIGREVAKDGKTKLVHPFTETVAAVDTIREAAATLQACGLRPSATCRQADLIPTRSIHMQDGDNAKEHFE